MNCLRPFRQRFAPRIPTRRHWPEVGGSPSSSPQVVYPPPPGKRVRPAPRASRGPCPAWSTGPGPSPRIDAPLGDPRRAEAPKAGRGGLSPLPRRDGPQSPGAQWAGRVSEAGARRRVMVARSRRPQWAYLTNDQGGWDANDSRVGWPRVALVALALVGLSTVATAAPVASEMPLGDTAPPAESTMPLANPTCADSTVGGITVDSAKTTGENIVRFEQHPEPGLPVAVDHQPRRVPGHPGPGRQRLDDLHHMPFTMTLAVGEVDGTTPMTPNETPIFINGMLNGTITGPTSRASPRRSTSTRTTCRRSRSATTSPRSPRSTRSTSRRSPPTAAGPASRAGSRPAVQVPEPASIAVFLVALAGGIGLRRRALARPAAEPSRARAPDRRRDAAAPAAASNEPGTPTPRAGTGAGRRRSR